MQEVKIFSKPKPISIRALKDPLLQEMTNDRLDEFEAILFAIETDNPAQYKQSSLLAFVLSVMVGRYRHLKYLYDS